MIETNIENNIATLILDRPEKQNALNADMIKSISNYIKKLNAQAGIRALIIKANGKHFCAGADIKWLIDSKSLCKADNIADAKKLRDMLELIETTNFVTISYVKGNVFGGGVGLMAATDIKVATPCATFCTPEVKLGMTPAIIGKYVINSIGITQAKLMMLCGNKVSASEALEQKLISQLVPENKLEENEDNLVKSILKTCPRAVRITKEMFDDKSPYYVYSNQRPHEIMANLRVSNKTQEKLTRLIKKA